MTAYDQFAYKGGVFSQTHPQRLQAVAKLFGLDTPALETCSVLELGCGDGANLIPMAAYLPHARFVGVDLAESPIAMGVQRIDRLGLHNIRLLQADVSALGESLGKFDYIIAHGLYSWVPPFVRDAILKLVQVSLTDRGVAYISYNALPGCRLRHLVREMLQFRFGARAFDIETIPEARAFLSAYAGLSVDANDHTLTEEMPKIPYLDTLKGEIQFSLALPDYVMFHDDLSEFATPFYLHEFAKAAQRHGLQYLGEPGVETMFPKAGSESFKAAAFLWTPLGTDPWVAEQQYLDFALGRRFKQSLLCKNLQRERDLAPIPHLERKVDENTIHGMHLRTALQPDAPLSQASLYSRDLVKFECLGRVVSVDEPIAKVSLHHLAKTFPNSVPVTVLIDLSLTKCQEQGLSYEKDATVQAMSRLLWSLVLSGHMEIFGQAIRVGGFFTPLDKEGPELSLGVESMWPKLSPFIADAINENLPLAGALHTEIHLEDSFSRALALQMDGLSTIRQLADIGAKSDDAAGVLTRTLEFVRFLDRQGALLRPATA